MHLPLPSTRAEPVQSRLVAAVALAGQATVAHRLDLALAFDGGTSAKACAAASARMLVEARFLLESAVFPDVGTAAQVVADWALTPPVAGRGHPLIRGVELGLAALGASGEPSGGRVVRIRGSAAPTIHVEQKDWGSVDVVHEHRLAGVYRLNVRPGGTIPNHLHRYTAEFELVLHEGLVGWRDGGPDEVLEVGSSTAWRPGQQHGYHNPTQRICSILCVDAPPFEPEDEVETPR